MIEVIVQQDKNNREIYAKMDGDDAADEARYGLVAAFTRRTQLSHKNDQEIKKIVRGPREYANRGPDSWM